MNIYKKFWMSIRKRLRLFMRERFFVKRVNDTLFLLDIKNRVDRHIDVSNTYEPEQVEYFTHLLQSNACSVFLDIGAHWGYYSLLLARHPKFKGIDIYAFEPDRYNRYQLYANLFLNKLEQVIKVYDCGLSDYDGEASFYSYHEGNRGRSHISTQGASHVEVRRLDGLLAIKDKVIGIKIDVEGYEQSVIMGMLDLLKNNQCLLQIESFENKEPGLSQQLNKSGYRHFHRINNDHYYTNIEHLG